MRQTLDYCPVLHKYMHCKSIQMCYSSKNIVSAYFIRISWFPLRFYKSLFKYSTVKVEERKILEIRASKGSREDFILGHKSFTEKRRIGILYLLFLRMDMSHKPPNEKLLPLDSWITFDLGTVEYISFLFLQHTSATMLDITVTKHTHTMTPIIMAGPIFFSEREFIVAGMIFSVRQEVINLK